jgi:hypothetical protein
MWVADRKTTGARLCKTFGAHNTLFVSGAGNGTTWDLMFTHCVSV